MWPRDQVKSQRQRSYSKGIKAIQANHWGNNRQSYLSKLFLQTGRTIQKYTHSSDGPECKLVCPLLMFLEGEFPPSTCGLPTMGGTGGGSGNKICGQTKHLSSVSWSAVITSLWTCVVLETWNQPSMYFCCVSSPVLRTKSTEWPGAVPENLPRPTGGPGHKSSHMTPFSKYIAAYR